MSRRYGIFLESSLILSGFLLLALVANAQNATDLEQKINTKNQEIEAIEREIAQYQTQLNETSKQAKTLQNAIKTIDLNRKKIEANISVTQKKIDASNLTINSLSLQIGDKESRIKSQREALGASLQSIREDEDYSLPELLVSYDTLSDFWNRAVTHEELQGAIRSHVVDLATLKENLSANKRATESEKRKLEIYKSQLADQKTLAEQNRREKDKILQQTKNKESEYNRLLQEKMKKREDFARELLTYESQLRLIKDPSSIPSAGKGIISWPLSNVFITQYFGDTEFARSGAYNGNGHNGLDFRASNGTPILSVQSGTVVGVGDTDTVCAGASYGRWVMIRHNNGLTSLYAHLSLIKVSEGQSVSRGQTIGYSGSTGYATGPHLHFTLYASEGVQIVSRKSRVCNGTYRLPAADLKAYLNPLSYL